MWKLLSVEIVKCGNCLVWKLLSVEIVLCGICFVWKLLSVEIVKCGILMGVEVILGRDYSRYDISGENYFGKIWRAHTDIS